MFGSSLVREISFDVCGVYLLVSDGEISYIGQSVNVIARCSFHRKYKKFARAVYVPCERQDLDQLEGALIRYFDPPGNGHRNQPNNASTCPGDPRRDREILRKYKFLLLPKWKESKDRMKAYRKAA